MYSLIVAKDIKQGIGKNGYIPWHYSEDMKHFRKITSYSPNSKQNVVIMGRKTWESIPEEFKPLKNRINIIISKSYKDVSNCIICNNILDVLRFIDKNKKTINHAFVIGGSTIYKQFLDLNIISKLYITEIHSNYDCDTFFEFPDNFQLIETSMNNLDSIHLIFKTYQYKNLEELNFLNELNNLLINGELRDNRTGIKTISQFGKHFRYSLRNNKLPLMTTRKGFLRGIFEELMWFLRGETDVKKLHEKDVHIWDLNSSKEFLESRNLDLEEGDIGAGYGFQWTHFGAKYINCKTDYTNQGYNQVKEAIRLIKEEPESRRIIITGWNPCDLDKMALPCCHVFYQFYVSNGELSCHFYQRSSDMFLANNWNVVSASLMTILFAHITGLKPKELYMSIGDSHIYENHIEQTKEQINRIPTVYPLIKIKDKIQSSISSNIIEIIDNLYDIQFEDLELLNYYPMEKINGKMAI